MNKLEDVIATSFELEKGFEGHIASIQLTDLIQLNCLRKATNALTVPSGNQKGIIYFKDGEIIHRVCGSPEGHEGKEGSVYLSSIRDNAILVLMFNTEIQIEMVRPYAKRASRELEGIFSDHSPGKREGEATLGGEFGRQLGGQLDQGLKGIED